MIPKSLSASSAQVFESCPSRWVVEYADRAAEMANSAASLGTACHEALEKFVLAHKMHDVAAIVDQGTPQQKRELTDRLIGYYDDAYHAIFSTDERFDEGAKLLGGWLARQTMDFWTPNRRVLSCEVKRNFELTAKDPATGEAVSVPFNYIMDRVDRIDNPDGTFDIEVVDYKTTMMPLQPRGLRDKVQARCYGVAAMIEHKGAARVFVTFDQLRHDPVGIVFTRDECVATYKYLKALLRRVLALDPTEAAEVLNPECRFCTRAPVCDTLRSHRDAGGILSITDPAEAAKMHEEIDSQIGGLLRVRDGLGEMLMKELADLDSTEEVFGDHEVVATARVTRDVDSKMVKDLLPWDVATEYGRIGVTQVDKILNDPRVDEEAKKKIKRLITRKAGEPRVKVKRRNPIDTSGDD